MPEPLTSLERRILEYVIDYLRRNTYQPSIREIGRRFDIKSTKTVSEYLQSLADKGWIERDPSRSRGVRLLGLDLNPDTISVPCYEMTELADAPAEDTPVESFCLDRRLAGSTAAWFLVMRGEGMEGAGIFDGDLLLVEPVAAHELEDGDVVYARLDGETVVRRYVRRGDDVLLEAAGSGEPLIHCDGESFTPGGRVIAIFRSLKVGHPAISVPRTSLESAESGV